MGSSKFNGLRDATQPSGLARENGIVSKQGSPKKTQISLQTTEQNMSFSKQTSKMGVASCLFHLVPSKRSALFGCGSKTRLPNGTLANGYGSKLKSWGYAGFSLGLHLPRCHFGTTFLSHSQMETSTRTCGPYPGRDRF